MKALITGISGFGGTYLAEELAAHGVEVFGLDHRSGGSPNTVVADLLDPTAIADAVTAVRPDVLFHLAAVSSVREGLKDPAAADRVNRDGTRNLLEAFRKHAPHAAAVIVSTAEVYGPGYDHPIREEETPHPANPYASSKLAEERVAREEFADIPSVIVRPFPYIGPGQRESFAIPSFCRQIVAVERGKQTKVLVGNLEARRDFSDVRDFSRAVRLLAQQDAWGQTVNICSGSVYSIGDLVQRLSRYAQVPVTIEVDPDRVRPNDIPLLAGDNAKLRTLTHWAPTVPIETTLRDTLEYWRAHKDDDGG